MHNRRPGGSAFCLLSLPHLVSNWSDLRVVWLQLTDFLSHRVISPTQSPTQSLEWHVWSSSSGNNCHAVHRSLFSGASVYECIMGFYLIPFRQPNSPTRFLSITGYWDESLSSGESLSSICTRLNGFKYCYQTLIVLVATVKYFYTLQSNSNN